MYVGILKTVLEAWRESGSSVVGEEGGRNPHNSSKGKQKLAYATYWQEGYSSMPVIMGVYHVGSLDELDLVVEQLKSQEMCELLCYSCAGKSDARWWLESCRPWAPGAASTPRTRMRLHLCTRPLFSRLTSRSECSASLLARPCKIYISAILPNKVDQVREVGEPAQPPVVEHPQLD